MNRYIIYSCVFFNHKYIDLINLLLISYKLFSNYLDNIDYLIICNPEFKQKIEKIYDNLNINGKIWCLNLNTKFESAYSRLNIFNYPDINLYNKILYLDCDILISNSINNIFNLELENKLYVLQEDYNRNFHFEIFSNKEFKLLDKSSAFSSGILLFNNHIKIKDLFSRILLHINNHITYKLSIPFCLDQPFIIYHAIKSNLYDNKKIINLAINNPNNFNEQIINHFPGGPGPGSYESKLERMNNFMNNILFNLNKNIQTEPDTVLIYKKYNWGNSTIEFLKDGNMNAFGTGKYKFIDKYLVKCHFGGREHLLKFNENYSGFISVTKDIEFTILT